MEKTTHVLQGVIHSSLLTAIFSFAILIIVNPPRAYFGRCGAFYCFNFC